MQKNRRARLEVKIEEQTRERDCSHDQYPPTEDVACDELSAASPVESRLHRTHLIGPHRWGGNVSYWGGDAKGVLKEKGGVVVFGCAIGRMHTPIECRRRSLVGPDARREFARVSPTAVRYLPLYLYRQRKLDLIPRWYSSLACWFSFDHCPLPIPTQPPSLPLILYPSLPLTHNRFSCCSATTEPRHYGHCTLSRQPLALTSSNFRLFVTGRHIRTRRSRPSAGTLRLLLLSSTCCVHHCDFFFEYTRQSCPPSCLHIACATCRLRTMNARSRLTVTTPTVPANPTTSTTLRHSCPRTMSTRASTMEGQAMS
jgi:hypothetical protein